MRIDASFLLAEGHSAARRYPLVVLWQEAQIARERVNTRMMTEALLIDAAIIRAVSGEGKHFESLIKGLKNGR